MKRTVIGFAVRHYSEESLEVVADRVGRALGCAFRDDDHHDAQGMIADLLGANVDLYDTRGLHDAVVFVLSSRVVDPRWLPPDDDDEEFEVVTIDITPVVIDVLEIRGCGEWHAPTDAEVAAELSHAARRRQRIEREEAAEGEARRDAGES